MDMLNWMGIDDDHLAAVSPHHSLHKDCINDFHALQQAAQNDGIDLQLCSSFRSFERQMSIWNRKWRGEIPLLDDNSQPIAPDTLTDTEKLHAILRWSALPGASRHHWGSDMDVYDKANVERLGHSFELIPQEYQNGGPCAALSDWMSLNLQSFGFYLPYATDTGGIGAEPWHISHVTTADGILKHFDPEQLLEQLKTTSIDGLPTITAEFGQIIQRYFYNKGNA